MNKNMMKKVITIAVAGAMAFSLAACGGTKSAEAVAGTAAKTTQEIPEPSLGGWELNAGVLSIDSNTAAKTAFEKATQGMDGYEYEAIALLGTQVVAGTNYSILARGSVVVPDTQPVYEIITIYEDLEGNAEITGSKTLIGGEGEGTDGGFTANAGDCDLDKNTEVKTALDNAMEKIDGSDYEAIAYLGSQVVQGTNYLLLMRETPVVSDTKPEFVLVTVYENLEGEAEILDMEAVTLDTADDTEAAIPDSENVQIPNPFEDFATLKEATAAVGFEMSVPDALKDYQTVLYRVASDLQMLEVIYGDENMEDEDGIEAYRIRKAVGSDDISGDYNDYEEINEATVGDYTVTLKGRDSKVYVAIWISGEYTYAIDVDMAGQGLSADEVTAIVGAVK